jgi:hypothetical protein
MNVGDRKGQIKSSRRHTQSLLSVDPGDDTQNILNIQPEYYDEKV